MRVDETYNIIVDIMRKERNGSISIPEFNMRASQGMTDAFNFYAKEYGVSQASHDAIGIFKKYIGFTSDANGLVDMPEDYAKLLRIDPDGSNYSVDLYNDFELKLALGNQVRAVSSVYRIGEWVGKKVQLYPKEIINGFISYLRLPLPPVYVATITGRSVVYNPTGSQDVEFGELYIWKVIQCIVQRCGINLSDEKTIAYSQLLQPTT